MSSDKWRVLILLSWMAAFFVVGELAPEPWRLVGYVGVWIAGFSLGALVGWRFLD
jgi:hypothetical protein